MKSHTKDEKYIITLYKLATAEGDPEAEVSRYAVANALGMHPNSVDNICNQLAKANFIKKSGDSMIYLSPQGVRLVESLTQ